MAKTITLTQVGWRVEGVAHLSLWGGGQGTINIDSQFVPLGELTKEALHRCINDAGFGCVSIDAAELYVAEEYEGGHREDNWRTIYIDNPNPQLVCRGIQGRQK